MRSLLPVVTLAVLALAACSPVGPGVAGASPSEAVGSPSSTSSVPRALTPTPTPTLTAGARIGQADAEEAEASGFGLYVFGDGTIELVDPHAPLTADVVADIRALLGPQTPESKDTIEKVNANDEKWTEFHRRAEHLDKIVIAIVYSVSTNQERTALVNPSSWAYAALPVLMDEGEEMAMVGRALNPAIPKVHGVEEPMGDLDVSATRARASEIVPTFDDPWRFEVIDLTSGW